MVSQFSLPLYHFDDLISREIERVIGIGDQDSALRLEQATQAPEKVREKLVRPTPGMEMDFVEYAMKDDQVVALFFSQESEEILLCEPPGYLSVIA